jgi:hypothetical protein
LISPGLADQKRGLTGREEVVFRGPPRFPGVLAAGITQQTAEQTAQQAGHGANQTLNQADNRGQQAANEAENRVQNATKQATQIQDAAGNCFDFGLAKLLNCHVATPLTIENAKLMAGIAPGWGNSWRISAITVALFNKTRRKRIECHDNQIK